MKNNDKNFDENQIEQSNNRIILSKINTISIKEYKNIFLCPLNKHDIVTSIDILDDLIIYGTIMGNVYLCRVNNNKKQKIKRYNLTESNNNDSRREKHEKNKSDDLSKISCIKLDENNNSKNFSNNSVGKIDKNEIKNDKNNILYDSELYPTSKNAFNKLSNNHEINTKRKLLTKNFLENKNSPFDNSSVHNQNSLLISNSSENTTLNNLPQVTQLIYNAEENIPCLSFDTKDKINVAIGDSDIFRFENILGNDICFTQIKNYNSENDHILLCEGALCFMSKNTFLKLDTQIKDFSAPIESVKYEYTNKTIIDFGVTKGEINCFNYLVPFDFDGDRLLCLDYESENIRRIYIYYTLTKINPFIKKINADFGHVSFMKFLAKDKIIICRKNKFCEIRLINEEFKLIEAWEHIGDEIIAMNVYIKSSENNEDEKEEKMENSMTELSYKMNNKKSNISDYDDSAKKNKKSKTKNKLGFNDNIYEGINTKLNIKKFTTDKDKINNSTFRELINTNVKKQFKSNAEKTNEISIYNKNKNMQVKENVTNELYNKKNLDLLTANNNEYINLQSMKDYFYDKEKKIYFPIKNMNEMSIENDAYIITVDKNGNFNKYHNGKIRTIFNLYEIKNIEQEYKDEEFFSLGFPYFVIMNNKYYAISTDFGIFVLSNKV